MPGTSATEKALYTKTDCEELIAWGNELFGGRSQEIRGKQKEKRLGQRGSGWTGRERESLRAERDGWLNGDRRIFGEKKEGKALSFPHPREDS